MDQGYVKLWRRSLPAGWLKNKNRWAFWSYCLIKATHKEVIQVIGNQQITLHPGEFIFGRKRAALDLDMTEQEIRTCLQSLSNLKNLTIKSTNKFSIISIVNWSIYQSNENGDNQQINTYLTSTQPALNHKQEHKNKNTKENKTLYLDFVMLTIEEHGKLIAELGEAKTADMIKRLNNYLGSTGKKYKSHYFTILNWERKDHGDGIKGHYKSSENGMGGMRKEGKYAGLGTIFEDD